MSFEGYYQVLCKKGHLTNHNCHMFDHGDSCSICGEEIEIANLVDETNGESDGYMYFDKIEEKKCEHCNTVLEEIYKPTKGK